MSAVAAIDCGTNSIRLLVADVKGDQLVEVTRSMDIVRLGQGVDRTRRIAPDALERTFGALRRYASTISELGAERVRMCATSATRDAVNRSQFILGCREILGVEPEVITGGEEAATSFRGATAELDRTVFPPPYLVCDIGGGSTEFVIGTNGAERAVSCDIGCVRLTERHLHDDPPTAGQVAAAEADIDRHLEEAEGIVRPEQAGTFLGLAGTVTTIAAISLALPAYDPAAVHLSRIGVDEVDRVTDLLVSADRTARLAQPAMHPGRADVIAAGGLVLRRAMRRWAVAECVASERDILDGIAWSLVRGGGRGVWAG